MGMICTGTQWLEGATPITTYPFTLNIWFKKTAAATDNVALGIGSNTTFDDHHFVQADDVGKQVRATSRQIGNPSRNASTGTYTDDTWFMLTGVYTSATDRAVFLNGTAKQSNTDSVIFAGTVSRLNVATVVDNTAHNDPWVGTLAEAAVYNTNLTDTDVSDLFGQEAISVKFGNLVYYATLRTGPTATVGATLAETGSPTYSDADHPPISANGPYLKSGLTIGGDLKPSLLK